GGRRRSDVGAEAGRPGRGGSHLGGRRGRRTERSRRGGGVAAPIVPRIADRGPGRRPAAVPLPHRGGVSGTPSPGGLLTLDRPVLDIDPNVASRRTGSRTKGPPAYEVLEEGLGIATVGELLRHYPRRYI